MEKNTDYVSSSDASTGVSTTASITAPTAPAKQASHDPANPPEFVDFMMRDWAPRKADLRPVKYAADHQRRRHALSIQFAGDVLVIPTGHEQVRANDTHFRFRPGTDFYYFTGCHEPDAVLVLEPTSTGRHRHVLYLDPNPGRSDPSFFTDRVKGELWVGSRIGLPEAQAQFLLDETRPLSQLQHDLHGWRGQATIRMLRGVDPRTEGFVTTDPESDAGLATVSSELRLCKDAGEVEELRVSIRATHRGFDDVIRSIGPQGLAHRGTERHVEGVFNLRARVDGNDVGYGTIAAAGCHACTLHWTRNDGPLRSDELLLLDAGIEGKHLYTADVTRTLPIGGVFTEPQRRMYELVLQAQQAGIDAVRPGADFMAPHRAAMRVLAEGLVRYGILRCTLEEALDENKLYYKRYTLHGTSHMLGLDVHDCARARAQTYKYGALQPGMVLTVEPGLYFQPDDETVPKLYRGIGIRIEDDVLVTETGCDVLSGRIPKTVRGITAWMKRLWDEAK